MIATISRRAARALACLHQKNSLGANASRHPDFLGPDDAPNAVTFTAFTVPTAGSFLNYDCHFNTGLTIVTGGTTAGSLTVEWY